MRWPWSPRIASDQEIEDAIKTVLRKKLSDLQPIKNPDLFRNWLAFFLISAFVAVLPLLIFKTIPKANEQIIVYIIGQLSGMATMALGFYFTQKAGQDRLDAARAETTGKMADAMTEVARSGGASDSAPAKAAAKAANEVADAAGEKADEITGAR